MQPLHSLVIDFGVEYGGPLEVKVFSESLTYIESVAKQALRSRVNPKDCSHELELILT